LVYGISEGTNMQRTSKEVKEYYPVMREESELQDTDYHVTHIWILIALALSP
jgi:hypothetical protein